MPRLDRVCQYYTVVEFSKKISAFSPGPFVRRRARETPDRRLRDTVRGDRNR